MAVSSRSRLVWRASEPTRSANFRCADVRCGPSPVSGATRAAACAAGASWADLADPLGVASRQAAERAVSISFRAERRPAVNADHVQMELSERPLGVFSRQIALADSLDTEQIDADYEAGVLTLRIPIAERAKPRKIAIGGESRRKQIKG